MTEYETVVGPVGFPEVFDEKMNKARAKYKKEGKTIVGRHFTAAAGILMCIFEVEEKKVARPKSKTQTGKA